MIGARASIASLDAASPGRMCTLMAIELEAITILPEGVGTHMPVFASSRSTMQPRIGLRHLRTHASLLVLIAASGMAASASAQSTLLHGAVGGSNAPAQQQSFPNVPVATLSGLVAHDAIGNDAFAKGSLNAPMGRFKLSNHACSGGGPGFAGLSNGSADASIILDYSIVSGTLPSGTPISVRAGWAMVSRVTAVGSDMVGANTNSQVNAGGQVAIAPNYNLIMNKTGNISRTCSASGNQVIRSGTLHVESDSASSTFMLQVGQVVRMTISGNIGANSSVESGMTDGDAQMSMVWGVTALNPAASAVLLSNPSQPAPPAELAIPDSAIALLPPRDTFLMPCFMFTTQPRDTIVCGSGTATFSAVPQGAGPFTYQWRKNGDPIDLQTNPSAQSATLSIPSPSGGDAGSYDVVIYNSCGNLVSTAAELNVCVLSTDSGPAGTRLAPARPAPFRTSTTLAFDLATAGDANLEIFDVRGGRVRTLASGWHEAGHSEAVWRGDNDAGRRVPAGVYLVRLRVNGAEFTQRVARTR